MSKGSLSSVRTGLRDCWPWRPVFSDKESGLIGGVNFKECGIDGEGSSGEESGVEFKLEPESVDLIDKESKESKEEDRNDSKELGVCLFLQEQGCFNDENEELQTMAKFSWETLFEENKITGVGE